MKKDRKLYTKIFLSTFFLSAFTFGGGYVIVPLMRKKFVNEYGWIDEQEMLDLIAIAQSSPGAIAINSSLIIGYKLGGMLGALVSLLGTVLPPLFIISVISMFYLSFKKNPIVNGALKGMEAGVAAVIADVVVKMIVEIGKKRDIISIVIMIAAFIATYYINIMWIIMICGVIGVAASKMKNKKKERE
ncbi:chromate transporter [Fusobacterium sp.]|uniref:chromate transporter n=1 Tax=Fusobacterium sp. TaxID=68766 RepID=UPI00396C4BBB